MGFPRALRAAPRDFPTATAHITCLCRGHEIYEVKQGKAILILGLPGENIIICRPFPAGSIFWKQKASYFAAEKKTMYKTVQRAQFTVMMGLKLGVKTEVNSEVL